MKKKKALILGLGESGKGAASFLLQNNYEVIGVDKKLEKNLPFPFFAEEEKIDLSAVDIIIISPGVFPNHPLAEEGRRRGIEVIGEVELGARYLKNRALGITGTNGKTTLCLLIAHLLNFAGKQTAAVGNVGHSICRYLASEQGKEKEEILSIELSSFQLETMKTPFLDVAIITNITPDHIDRYSSHEEYKKAKLRIVNCLKPSGTLFLSHDLASLSFSLPSTISKEVVSQSNYLQLKTKDRYLQESELLAYAACRKFGLSEKEWIEGLKTFKRPPHRIQFVAEVKGVSFYDDSKATNLEAVIYAALQLNRPFILIAGGRVKEHAFYRLKEPLKGKVKRIFCIGEAKEEIYRELGGNFPVVISSNLRAAVQSAYQSAEKGDTVLLSPGCSSFDQFNNYVHRGEEFQKFVHELDVLKEMV